MVLVLVVGGRGSVFLRAGTNDCPGASPFTFADPQPDTDLDQFRFVGRLGRDQPRQHFLERLENQASSGFGRALADQSGGGRGASEATDAPQFSDLGRGLRDLGQDQRAGAIS